MVLVSILKIRHLSHHGEYDPVSFSPYTRDTNRFTSSNSSYLVISGRLQAYTDMDKYELVVRLQDISSNPTTAAKLQRLKSM